MQAVPVAVALMSLFLSNAAQAAGPVPAKLPRPDGKPGDTKKPVKVYIMAGQSNMVGFGTPRGARCAYNGIYLTADPDTSFGPFAIFPGGNYKIAPLGIYVSADPGSAKGASASVYKGAYDAGKAYAKEQPVRTETIALGVSKGVLPAAGTETCVVTAFIEVPESGNYTCSPGYGDSAFNVMELDGKEVYRKNVGQAAVRQRTTLEAGKRYPIRITYFKGGSTAFWMSQEDLVGRGDLESLTQRDKLFPWLSDDEGKWTVRNDVYYFDARDTFTGSPLSPASNGKFIGPELGFGYVMGTFHDEQVLLIKTAMGNRALNFDFRPPSSGRTQPTNNFESLEYKLMVEGVRKTLDGIATNLPGYAGQGYEIAGFVWWQGHKDKGDPKEEYEKHLVNLINDLRKEFNVPKMPAAIATVGFGGYDIEAGPWKGIWEAQMAVGDAKQHPESAGTVASVDTRGFWRAADESPSGVDYHYNRNAETYMLTGDALGRAMVQMLGGKAEPLPYGNRPKPAVKTPAPAAAQELDEAAKAAAAMASQKALEPIIVDGMLRAFVADPGNKAALQAAVKGEKPANAPQFLRDTVDGVNDYYVAAGVRDFEWHAFGPAMNNAEWDCFSFDPPETLDKAKEPRYRKVTYPEGMANWFAPDFDAAKAGWKKGLPPFGNKDGKLEPLGRCTNDPCLCGVTPRTLWEKEVLLIRGTFDLPAFKEGHRYRFVVGGSNHVMAGDGYAIYVNGKRLAESETGVPNRAGGQPRGGHVYADLRDDFKGGKVTIAVTSFQQFNRRTAEGKPMGHLTVWIEEQNIPPVEP